MLLVRVNSENAFRGTGQETAPSRFDIDRQPILLHHFPRNCLHINIVALYIASSTVSTIPSPFFVILLGLNKYFSLMLNIS